MKKIKPLYKIRWHDPLTFSYECLSTGNKHKWDVYAITCQGLSMLPRQFVRKTVQRVSKWKERNGRSVDCLVYAVMEAGKILGWDVSYDKKRRLVFWTTLNAERKRKFAVAIAILHYSWRKHRRMLKNLYHSQAYMRFVVDSGGRSYFWAQPKRDL